MESNLQVVILCNERNEQGISNLQKKCLISYEWTQIIKKSASSIHCKCCGSLLGKVEYLFGVGLFIRRRFTISYR